MRRIAYLLAVLLVLSTTAMKAEAAPEVSQEVRKWYDTVEALAAGSKILVDYAITQDVEAEIGPFAVAVFHHIFRKPRLKTIFVSMMGSQSMGLWEAAILETNPDIYGKKYGEDYALLRYIAGTETAMAALGKNIETATKTDYKGTPLAELPVMKNIIGFSNDNAKVFTLLICFTAGRDIAEGWARQWVTPYKTRYLCCTNAKWRSTLLPYYRAGQMLSLTTGSQSAEYEELIGKLGRGTQAAKDKAAAEAQAAKDKAIAETMTNIVYPIAGIALIICVAIIALRYAHVIRYRRRRKKLDFYLEKK